MHKLAIEHIWRGKFVGINSLPLPVDPGIELWSLSLTTSLPTKQSHWFLFKSLIWTYAFSNKYFLLAPLNLFMTILSFPPPNTVREVVFPFSAWSLSAETMTPSICIVTSHYRTLGNLSMSCNFLCDYSLVYEAKIVVHKGLCQVGMVWFPM